RRERVREGLIGEPWSAVEHSDLDHLLSPAHRKRKVLVVRIGGPLGVVQELTNDLSHDALRLLERELRPKVSMRAARARLLFKTTSIPRLYVEQLPSKFHRIHLGQNPLHPLSFLRNGRLRLQERWTVHQMQVISEQLD